ncbi:hypothetical protein CYMTET_46789 [Cymbomonas tetramitiformis]|uniref:ARID domain-containing protein n=1 Tax=Cymbomonas tetramitiformis TaxID=36881 RepID=A0AAE0BVG4_9CHLO|nr:hypothetical protein CYMTET_46789 [Cymbomonas tetramitiformis]
MEETADTLMDQVPDAEEVPGEEPGNTSEHEPEVQRGTAAATYPVPLSTHEEVFASRDIFIDTLQKFHLSFFGTPLGRVPQVAGKELDLHVLYTQVTEKGGLDEVIKEKRWKEISSAFNFPATCTSGSFTLRKYYAKLLHDYEQVYYFRKEGAPVPPPVFAVLATGKGSDVGTPVEVKQPKKKQKKSHPTETPTQPLPMPQLPDISALVGSTVSGSVDSAFEFGYFITVNVNGQDYKGVLYQSPEARGEPLINPTFFPSISAALGADGNPMTPASIGHKKKKKYMLFAFLSLFATARWNSANRTAALSCLGGAKSQPRTLQLFEAG